MFLSLNEVAQDPTVITNYQWWDLFYKAIGIIGVIAALFTAGIGVKKYFYEKNRDVFIKRLNEVYAPLYGLLIKQETFRRIYLPNSSIISEPILTLTSTNTQHSYNFELGRFFLTKEESRPGVLDRKEFIKALNSTNKGLARPNLLNLIYQYEMLIYLEELNTNDEKWDKATSEKVRIELLLIREIVWGYRETVKLLDLDDNHTLNSEEDFFAEALKTN